MGDPMNAQEMLDYTLGQLEGSARERAETELSEDPALAERIDRLGRAVHQLLDDGDEIVPPAGLARRTIAFAAEHGQGQRRRRSILDFVPVTVPFRWADVAVAAGIIVASLLTLVPALQRSRDRMNQAGCAFNLQQLGVSLAQYAALHGHYPYAPADQPNAAAGTFAVTLRDSGMLHDVSMLDCPCNGKQPHHHSTALPHLDKLPELKAEAPEQYRRMIGWDYAYNVGYRRESGQPGPVPVGLRSRVPLLADQPGHDDGRILEGNSPNHGLRGQNVLFTDGHVNWHNTRRVSPLDPDLFLNAEQELGPGVNVHDAVLAPSVYPFRGR